MQKVLVAAIICCLAIASANGDAAKPAAAAPQTAVQASSADMVRQKMERIIFPSVEFDNADIFTVIRYLNRGGKRHDPDNAGIAVVSGVSRQDAEKFPRYTLKATQISFTKLLNQLKLNYKIDEGAIVIMADASATVK